MLASKRHGEILKLLEIDGSMAVSDLAERLGVSLETIRRDIKPLAESGAVLRMHGAVALPSALGEAPFEKRMREMSAAKKKIAESVARTIADGESLMLDTGTTTSFLARELLGHRRLTVITNSSDIARVLASVNGNRVYMAGGEIRPDSGAVFGLSASEFITRFSVDHAIISAGAVDPTGILDYALDEAEFARTVLSRGRRKLAVTDSSKFTRAGLVHVCGFADLTDIVTEAAPPVNIADAIRAADARLTVAS
ncbi:DeoR/GlpR family DNA-binding transcription regulator [Rhizobium sp. C4]|uniref:DeoR/GlpR family DNA-binding transcription regulator n=1 Tax=Rhizobium sp. C4 TaxID=1349800 RepID=UPI001E39D3A0|nr:DeoR/GlpR family DNA-binding transcription regulator [Rhizobium sp. C4]MCD2173440.1 DeoR/GlpR family DNA-binding transcription regulator [Rhizobium sp. C4]